MIKSASRSSITNNQKHRSMLAGTVPSNEYLIESRVLDTAVSAVTFDNLAQFAGVYKHLQIVTVAKSTQAGTGSGGVSAIIELNGSGLTSHYLYGEGTTVLSGFVPAYGFMLNLVRAGVNGAFSASVTDLLDVYSTSKNKTLRSIGGYTSELALASGLWQNTASVSSITIKTTTDSFAIGSRFSLYGLTA